VQKAFVSIKNTTPPKLLSANSNPMRTQNAFFEWYIQEERITFCPHLAEIIAFETKENFQSHLAWTSLTHPDDTKPIKTAIEKIKNGETSYIATESRKLCRDGKWRWFRICGKTFDFDNEGKPLRAIGTCTDISSIKEAELQLEQIRLLFNEKKRIKDCYKNELSLNELCAEILKSFEKLTNSTNPLLILAWFKITEHFS